MKSVARLYNQFQPNTYDITIALDEDAMRFSGTVTIKGKKVGRPSQRLTLHQNGLKVTNAKITKHDKKGDQELAVARINNQNSLQELRLHTDGMVYPGEYTLTMDFAAPITDTMNGLYPCYYTHDGERKKLLATDLESHHAREVFPCIDEPEAKAVYNLTLVTRPGITTLSNTPIKTQAEEDGKLVTAFETTPKMSSYLFCFVTGDMHCKTTQTNRGTGVSIWATVAQPADSLDFALDVAKRSIEFFEDYFGMEYPLAKSDNVALPDFSAGAMENWGLITYRERALLAYPGETAKSTLEQIAETISHEVSHQWFGNLVTMRWWDDLWLNESFANMMSYQALETLFPEWNMWNDFTVGWGLSAYRRDAVAGVQPVRTDVHHPDEINTLFDPSIVYAKGGRLLYMLKNFIGEEAFRAGLKDYFQTHAYGNTTGADLWAALGKASGKDINSFMEPWLTRSGYPLVTVTQEGANATLTQEHFQDDRTKADPERLWPIPLFTNTPGQPAMFSDKACKLQLPSDDTLLVNTDARGYYIIRYASEDRKQAVLDMIRNQTLSETDRLMLLNWSSMLGRAGYSTHGEALQTLAAYEHEDSQAVWDIMAVIIGETRRFIDQDPALEDKLKPYVDKLVAEQVARLGWEESTTESQADAKLRALVLGLSTYADNEATIAKAKELFAAYKDSGIPVPAELRSLIFTVPVKYGDEEAFDYLINLYDTTANGDLKSDIMASLSATRDPERAKQQLARFKDSKLVKPQDIDHWLVYLLRNRYTRAAAWDWMVANWEWLQATFGSDKSYDILPRYAASAVNTREYEQKFRDLFESKQNQITLKRNIQMGFEEISTRVAWLERDLPSVQKFFS